MLVSTYQVGCDLDSGLTKFNNLDGDIFVTGRNSAGIALTADRLWGILNFVWDAMDLYGDDDPLTELFQLTGQYREETWQPSGGDGGIAIFGMNADETGVGGKVDHRN